MSISLALRILFAGLFTLFLALEYCLGCLDMSDFHVPTIELGHSRGALQLASSLVVLIWCSTLIFAFRHPKRHAIKKVAVLFLCWIFLVALGGTLFTRVGNVGEGSYHLEFLGNFELVKMRVKERDYGGAPCLSSYRRHGRFVTFDDVTMVVPYLPLLTLETAEFEDAVASHCCSGCSFEVQ